MQTSAHPAHICAECAHSAPAKGWAGIEPDELACHHPQAQTNTDVITGKESYWLCLVMRAEHGACGPEGRLFRQTQTAANLSLEEFPQDAEDASTEADGSGLERSVQTPSFTPGPWAWSETGYSLRPAEPNPDVHHVHTILEAEDIGRGFRFAEFKDSLAEGDANLALIAAAPDLYDAAEAAAAVLLHRKWKGGATNPQAIALAKLLAALDKARTVVPTYVIS